MAFCASCGTARASAPTPQLPVYAPPQPAYPPTPYGAYPQQPYYYPQSRGTNGLAIASLVLGVLWLYWIGSILALIFGYVARRQIKRSGQDGNGLAIAGIVLGWIGVAVMVVVIILLVSVSSSCSSEFGCS